jgi:hemerythrin-like domain-containing protein
MEEQRRDRDANRNRNDPFEQLRRSHRRLEERLLELARAASEAQDPARKHDALNACDEVLGFFERAVARHEADEELSLFPRLASIPALADDLATLAREHVVQRRLVDELAGLLAGAPDPNAIADVAARLATSYASHITLEESRIFPSAETNLSPEARAAMVAEMEERRGRGRR